MSLDRLRQELAESKTELDSFKKQMSSGMTTVHKCLSMISLVRKWSGAENASPLKEFLASIDRATTLGKWQDADYFNIAVLADPGKRFTMRVQNSTRKTRRGRTLRAQREKDFRTYTAANII